ncbi:MAG: NUDIX domain-containing protein, partial [Chromatiales bacterium]|nr:NUDIX domain-containing protein [Chromatiales bacterium]
MRIDQSNFQLPVVGVGAIVIHEGAVLLVKRGKAPHKGEWAIPGGKLKWGETLQQGAEREILEETGIAIEAGELLYHFEHIVPAKDRE